MNCSICYENLNENCNIIKLECSHIYCNECFYTWYSQKGTKELCCLCFKRIELENYNIEKEYHWTEYIDLMQNEIKQKSIDKKIILKYFKKCIKILKNGFCLFENKIDNIIYRAIEKNCFDLIYYLFENLHIKTTTLRIDYLMEGLISEETYDLDPKIRIDIIRYLNNKKCIDMGYDITTLVSAVESEKLEIVKFAHLELNVKFTLEALEIAYKNKSYDIIEYLEKVVYEDYKEKLKCKYM